MKGALEIDAVSVSFSQRGMWRRKEISVLKGVDLIARPGEVLAIVGSSAAGKSVLLHSIIGILPPNAIVSGTIRLDGAVIDARRLARLRGRRLALVPQSITHLDPLVPIGRQLAWAARRAGEKRHFDAAVELRSLGLESKVARQYPSAVSGGMARRVLLAAALAGNADVILADEPTDGLDPANVRIVLSRLRGLADSGRTVVVVTHDLAAAAPYADRVTVMRGGCVLAHEDARNFAGAGERLRDNWSRQLWRALPQNEFASSTDRHA